jgi:ParB-like chromosome segregation protein Spo0J
VAVNAGGRLPLPRRGESSDYLLELRDKQLATALVHVVPLDRLVVAYTARVTGESPEYASMLAESEAELPPVVVHRSTMTVIDGVHRLRAARLRGRRHIAVRFFDGTEDDARLLSVATNVAQGRPLSTTDRTTAAERIFRSHPQWSDRAVAAVVGLSASKVSQIRRRLAGDLPPAAHRVGRDGRIRPVSSARGREMAGELLREQPAASLRQIAKHVGISPATVADVRDRLRRGEDPVPERQRLTGADDPIRSPAGPLIESEDPPARPSGGRSPDHQSRDVRAPAELLAIFDALRRDPSLRFNEAGRSVLRMLDVCAAVVRDRRRIVATVPPHCKEPMSRLADGYAEIWRLVAEDLRHAGDDEAGDLRQDTPLQPSSAPRPGPADLPTSPHPVPDVPPSAEIPPRAARTLRSVR